MDQQHIRIFMKKIFLILFGALLIQPLVYASKVNEDDWHLERSAPFVVPYLDVKSLMATRCVSRQMHAAVTQHIYREMTDYITAFPASPHPFFQDLFNKIQNTFIEEALNSNEFLLIRWEHPFNPVFLEYAQAHDLTWGHASLLLEQPLFEDAHGAMQWEDQVNWMIYTRCDLNLSTVQEQMDKKIKASNTLYIPSNRLNTIQTPKNYRVLWSGNDYLNENDDFQIKSYITSNPKGTLVVDMYDGIVLPPVELRDKALHWVFTNTTNRGAFADWFLHKATLPEGYQLQSPSNLKGSGMGFMRYATLPAGFIIQIPLGILEINNYFLESAKLGRGCKLYLPPNLQAIGFNFMYETTLPKDFTLTIPKSLQLMKGGFFYKAEFSGPFTLHLSPNLKIIEEKCLYKTKFQAGLHLYIPEGVTVGKDFMARIKIPLGWELVGLDAFKQNLYENNGISSQPMEIHIIQQIEAPSLITSLLGLVTDKLTPW